MINVVKDAFAEYRKAIADLRKGAAELAPEVRNGPYQGEKGNLGGEHHSKGPGTGFQVRGTGAEGPGRCQD